MRSTFSCSGCILSSPVAAHDFYFRVGKQPGFDGLLLAVGKDLDWTPQLKIDQQRPVDLALFHNQSSIPRMRTDVGGGQSAARKRRSSVGAEIIIPSEGASRSLTWALLARPSAISASRSRLVMRAYDCTRSGSLSVKILRGQVGTLQTNLRTVSAKMTRRPAQGRSATSRP